MSESSQRQFDATPSRIAKAKREGNFARSQELGANIAFIAGAVCLGGIAPAFAAVAQRAIAGAAQGRDVAAECSALAGYGILVIAVASIGGIVASLAQTGGFVFVAPAPKFARLVPAEGLKRMLSRETATHAARAIAAFAVASLAIVASVHDIADAAVSSARIGGVASAAWTASQHVAYATAAVGVAFSALEYGVARRAWLGKLKMSFHDLKREVRENDGDPMARQRRKAMHRSLIRGALSKVKDAAFVVVNPTHVAVALEYRPPDVPVPVVLVRAAEEMALRVREEAARAGVPVIENAALARALFAHTDVGEPIPADHYVAIAEIVARLVRIGALD